MTTKKPVTDTDVVPEYDFRDSVPNPYADRYWQGRAGSPGAAGPSTGRPDLDEDIGVELLLVTPGSPRAAGG